MRMKTSLSLLLFLGLIGQLHAQKLTTTERYTEQEVMELSEFLAADAQRVRENWEEAETLLKAYLEKDRDNAAAHFSLAQVYAATERYDEAERAARKALDHEADNEWYYRLLGTIHEMKEEDDKAAEVYATLSKRYPEREYFAQRRAYFLVRAGEPKEAIGIYDELEKRFGISEETSRDKHRIYLAMGDYKRAERELRSLVDAFPDNTDYQHYLANFYLQTERPADARKTYSDILRIDPNDARAQVAVVSKGSGTGDTKLSALEDIFAKPDIPLDVKVKQLIPYVQRVAETSDLDVATQLLPAINTLEEVHGKSAKIHALRGDLSFYTGQPEQAYNHYAAALDLDQSVFAVWEQALFTLDRLGNYETLASQSERALDYFPNQPSIYLLNARAYNQTGDHSSAMNSLMQAELMVQAGSPLYYIFLVEKGKMQLGTKDLKAARTTVEAAQAINQDRPELLLLQADLLEAEGKPSKADALRERVRGMSKDERFMRGL